MQYLFTERAHLMCPQMCFGIVLSVPRSYDEGRIRAAADLLAAAHPFLRALLGYEEAGNRYFYRVTGSAKTELVLKDRAVSGTDAPEIMEECRRLTGRDWDLFEEGMLKIAAWPAGGETCFLMVFHHLLTDGRGALGLAAELAEAYVSGTRPAAAEEQLIQSADDLPAESRLPPVSSLLIRLANRAWIRENRRISWPEYHAFADAFLQNDPVRRSVSRMSREETESIRKTCRDQGITVNDWLAAKMMAEEKTGKVIIACDLRGRLACFRQGALGNYASAFSVKVRKGKKNLPALAKAVHGQVRKKISRPGDLFLVLQCYAALDPGLLDAAFISCRGDFPGRAGRFAGRLFFGYDKADGCSVTNLGRIESSSISSAFFIPPASPAIRTIWGVLTVNGRMAVCVCRR